MPECNECRHVIDEGDAFCRACGAATGVATPGAAQDGAARPRPASRRDLPFVLILVGVALAIAVLLGLVVSFGPSASDFVGTWSAGEDVGVDMVISMNDGALQASIPGLLGEDDGSAVPGTLSGDTATFEYVADTSADAAGTITVTATLEGDDTLRMTMSNIFPGVDASSTIVLSRVSAAESEAAAADQQQQAQDSAVKEGIHSLQVGVQSWAVDHNDKYPPADALSPDGAVGRYIDSWPTNPFTDEPMKAGEGQGDFTYKVTDDRLSFTLSGHLGDGTDFTVP
jgi:hypothetical protein